MSEDFVNDKAIKVNLLVSSSYITSMPELLIAVNLLCSAI